MTSAQALSGGIINNSGTITSASIGAGAIANIGSTGAFNNTLVDEKAKLHVASGGALNGISATVDTNMTGVHFSGAAVNETGSLLGWCKYSFCSPAPWLRAKPFRRGE